MNKDKFIEETGKLGIKLSDQQQNQLEIYAKFLIEYNTHTNLTAITDEDDIYLKHFYDSLTTCTHELIKISEIETLVDVGTGAGFPGLVLKIAYPHLKVTLIDSNNKKTKFLTELCTKLKLSDVEILNVRSEEYALNNLDKYDLVVSRAVANLNVLTEICLPMVKVGGYFIALKSNVDDELENAKNKITLLKGSISTLQEFSLPNEDSKRTIVIIKKLDKTPKGYPRSYAKIKKENI